MVVPPIGFDSIEMVPLTNLTRSCMLVRPKPLPKVGVAEVIRLPKGARTSKDHFYVAPDTLAHA
jgi:hypothetical protein